VSEPRVGVAGLTAALLAAASSRVLLAAPSPLVLLAAAIPLALPAQPAAAPSAPSMAQATAALNAGEADKALALLQNPPTSGPDAAQAHNLLCRVRFTLEQFDAAATECEQAVRLDGENSSYHLWLGRALGERAARASFLNAFNLAKRTRAEFEEAVHLDPRNVEALTSLGEFYRQAPGVVGGGVDKAQAIASQLDKVDPARAHELRGKIAEQQKDFPAAESEYKQEIAGQHPAFGWNALAGFYFRRQRFADMESAMHSVVSTALHDRRAAVVLYDAAGQLIEANRDPALAATMLDDYLSGSFQTEEAPAFIAHLRLARLRQQLGDPAAAAKERAAALALAHDYKPAKDFKPPDATP
jgi:tetratricopeptide (TPR) repeat protein